MSLIGLISLWTQTASGAPDAGPTTTPSPAVLTALTDLIRVLQGQPAQTESVSWWTPVGLNAIAGFISAVVWPALALFIVLRFSPQLIGLFGRMTKVEVFGVKADIQTQLDRVAEEASSLVGLSRAPSKEDLRTAGKVEEIFGQGDSALIRQQVDILAAEYEDIRASMPSGDARTRRMEVVFAKMRAIGRAAYGIRYELIQSPSPGRRLQAIAALQVGPDYELLDWLADRILVERPFVSYHALVALNMAAADKRAQEHVDELQVALQKAVQNAEKLPAESDRLKVLNDFKARVTTLKAPIIFPRGIQS
jgi:hypothetical protein